jgi:6-phosphogluconolactonase
MISETRERLLANALSSLMVCFVLLATPLRAQFVYVANFSGNVSAYSISSNVSSHGALIPVPGSPFAAGNEPVSVAVDPTGKFAYVANDGNNVNVSAFSIGANGALMLNVPGSPFAAGITPHSVAI